MAQTLLPKDPKARLRFETLLADVSSRFVKLPAGRIGQEVEESLREMAVFFDADRCALPEEYVPRLRRLRGLYPSVSKDSRHSARGVHC